MCKIAMPLHFTTAMLALVFEAKCTMQQPKVAYTKATFRFDKASIYMSKCLAFLAQKQTTRCNAALN